MSQRTRVIDKTSMAKREKSNSYLRKTNTSNSINSPVDRILFLQRTIGNQAVQRLIKSGALQAKLRIGQPGDKYEQVADAVMRMPELQVQPQPEEEEEELHAKETSGHISEVTPNLESHIQSLKGGGKPLPESERAYFEPRFGRDFSQVRVHSDAQAADSARAFTVGQDVVFGEEQYAPETILGRDFPNIKNRISSPEVVNTSEPLIDSKYQIR